MFLNDSNVIGDSHQVATTYTKELLRVGDVIAVDDGLLTFTVIERLPNGVKTRVENSGLLMPNKVFLFSSKIIPKGINFPLRTIKDLPAVSEKDKHDISFAIEQNVDYISISCIRDIDDVEEVRYFQANIKT